MKLFWEQFLEEIQSLIWGSFVKLWHAIQIKMLNKQDI